MLIVATCGLSAVLGSQVARQSWEIGVLRAIGARDRDVIAVVMTEALCATIAGALLALPVAALTTVALIQLIHLATSLPMPTTISGTAPVVWSAASLVCAALASIAPCMRALRLTVREALVV
jgi:putative ABC transport system permease protein